VAVGQRQVSITITEGEIDALSVSQAFRNKYPVVSVPNGAQSAAKALAENYEYLDKFDKIVLMFDMDKPGREASECGCRAARGQGLHR
jgi:twinkle protein